MRSYRGSFSASSRTGDKSVEESDEEEDEAVISVSEKMKLGQGRKMKEGVTKDLETKVNKIINDNKVELLDQMTKWLTYSWRR